MAQPELIKDIEARVKKSGDTMTGNLIGQYFQGTWLQTSQVADLGKSPSRIAVIRDDGWLYYRTSSELAEDIGLTGNYVLKSGDTMTGNLTAPTFIGSLQGNASSSTYSTYTYFRDTRNANEMPLDMLKGVSLHLKSNSADGLSDGLSYHPVLMLRDWNDLTGGPFAELTITGNQNLYFRSSTTSADNAWNPWRKVLTDYNYKSILNNTYLPLTGGTLSGSVKITGGTFNYSTIQNGTSNSDRNIWFSTSGSRGIPCYNDNFKYNPSTNTLTVGNITGNAKTATLAMSSKDTGHASYRTTSSTSYLLVRIKSAQSYWMTAFTLRVYQGYNHYDITFSGYQYGANYWYSPKATLSSSTIANLTVYFGYISQAEMWVAIPGGDYTGAKILNVVNGYYNFTDIANAFTIENATSLPGTIQSTQTIYRPWIRGEAVTGAVWNDYAEYRESDFIEPGYCLIENGDDTLSKSTERMQPWAGISSDTWGFAQGQTEKAQTPIAVAGRVLVYPYRDRNEYKSGDCVCTAPDGKVDIMTEEEIYKHPDKIIGIVSCVPDYEEWGGGENADRPPVKVDGRIWVRVK